MKKILFLFTLLSVLSCNKDDDDPINEDQCTYEGLTFLDNSNNIQTLIPEAQLQTDFFPNNGGVGVPAVEIYESTNPGNIFFFTDIVTLNATGSGTITINGTNYP